MGKGINKWKGIEGGRKERAQREIWGKNGTRDREMGDVRERWRNKGQRDLGGQGGV